MIDLIESSLILSVTMLIPLRKINRNPVKERIKCNRGPKISRVEFLKNNAIIPLDNWHITVVYVIFSHLGWLLENNMLTISIISALFNKGASASFYSEYIIRSRNLYNRKVLILVSRLVSKMYTLKLQNTFLCVTDDRPSIRRTQSWSEADSNSTPSLNCFELWNGHQNTSI